MPRKSTEPLEKQTLHFYAGDYRRLQELYPELGASVVVRKLVRKHLEKIEATQDMPTVEVGDANL